ncbi:MAG: hypothetical protein ACE5G3_06330 [Gammaproteobacteria bacterium]
MKTLRQLSVLLQGLGISGVLLLLSQSAFAIGTDENTSVNNRATVDYAVGGVGQVAIESAPGGNSTPGATNGTDTTFLVDRLIDFELVGPAGNTIIVPDQIDAVLTFTLTNSGNDHQDFVFSVTNLAGDDFDMNEITSTLRVFVDGNGNGVYDAGVDTATFVDELVPDGSTTATIFVVADADNPTPTDGDLANLQLEARAHDGNNGTTGAQGALAADHSADLDLTGTVQNVFGELGLVNYDNRFEATGTYEVQTAALTVTKTSAVISDPFSSAPNWKAIPGAVVEYTVTIVNNGVTAADNVSVSDTIQIANVTFNDGDPYATGDATITVNAADVISPGSCQADAVATDGCTYDAGTGALVLGTAAGVSIPAGQTAVFTYQVTIN